MGEWPGHGPEPALYPWQRDWEGKDGSILCLGSGAGVQKCL